MTLPSAILELQTQSLSLEAIKEAPSHATEGADIFPFAVSYPRLGRFQSESSGWGRFYHTIVTEFHVGRQILPEALKVAIPLAEAFVALILADPTLAGTVAEVNEVNYSFGRLEWAGQETIGYRFEIQVKIMETV